MILETGAISIEHIVYKFWKNLILTNVIMKSAIKQSRYTVLFMW